MADDAFDRLRGAVLEALENQLREDEPPEARQTLERLMGEGYSREDAKTLIARVLAIEINEVITTGLSYNQDRYLKALATLPDLPE